MSEKNSKYPSVERLIENFFFFLNYYKDYCPFTKPGQLEYHRNTIQQRFQLGSVKAALKDDFFLKSLYKTLQAWGIGSRRSKIKSFNNFVISLNELAQEISMLDNLKLDQEDLVIDIVAQKIWKIMNRMQIVDNIATLVPCSKTLHHILPDLVVPMDREYTQLFFGWQNPQFQYGQENCFKEAFRAFARISKEINPSQYIGNSWNTSLTKVIDNSVVGLVLYLKSKLNQEI